MSSLVLATANITKHESRITNKPKSRAKIIVLRKREKKPSSLSVMFHQYINLLALLGLVSTSISGVAALTTKRQGTPGIYVCEGEFWEGSCYYSAAPLGGACHNAQHNIQSFGPDKGVTCDLYDNINCNSGDTFFENLSYPGSEYVFADARVKKSAVWVGSWSCTAD